MMEVDHLVPELDRIRHGAQRTPKRTSLSNLDSDMHLNKMQAMHNEQVVGWSISCALLFVL